MGSAQLLSHAAAEPCSLVKLQWRRLLDLVSVRANSSLKELETSKKESVGRCLGGGASPHSLQLLAAGVYSTIAPCGFSFSFLMNVSSIGDPRTMKF